MMSEKIKYGTDNKMFLEKYKEAESIFKDFEDCNVETVHDVFYVVFDLMRKYGHEGHPDGSETIALILWRLLKK